MKSIIEKFIDGGPVIFICLLAVLALFFVSMTKKREQ